MVYLLVGEGDFSYAVSFAAEVGPANVVATCLESSNPKVDDRIDNLEKLRAMGVRALTDVDARAMHKHPWLSQHCTDLKEIIFNFPHIGGKMKIGENRRLLREFFVSAGRLLRPGSCARVTLCRGQGGTAADAPRPRGDTWQVVEMATFGGFVLRSVQPFPAPPGYHPRGYRGGAKGFHTDGALTHTFCLVGSAVPATLSAASIRLDGDTLADRIRSRMDNVEHVLGQTVQTLAAALATDSSQLTASFANETRNFPTVTTPWEARLVCEQCWSPLHPPLSHVLDVSTTEGALAAVAAIQELCHNHLTPLRLEEDGGYHLLCRDLHVATLRSPGSHSSVLEGDFSGVLRSASSSSTTFQGPPLTLSVKIELLAMAASGLGDWRLLLLPAPEVEPSLCPPCYTHDLSFWLDEDFDEGQFLRLLHSAAGDVLRSVELIDEYYREEGGSGRRSRCYRLCYQSLWRALSAEVARDFHLELGAAIDELLPSVRVR